MGNAVALSECQHLLPEQPFGGSRCGSVALVASLAGTSLVHSLLHDRFAARRSYITLLVACGVALSTVFSVVRFVRPVLKEPDPNVLEPRAKGLSPAKGADNVELLSRIEALMKKLFQLHDLDQNGFLEEMELIKLNEKIAMLHYGKDTDRDAVKAKYSEVFRTRLNVDGDPVTFDAFRAYMSEVLDKTDRDKFAQELMLEQFVEEARSGRRCFRMASFISETDPLVHELSMTDTGEV